MKNALFYVIQLFAHWLLRITGNREFYVPKYMDNYWPEIERLVLEEEQRPFPGYFLYRRVFTKMNIKYPALNKRDLSKAIQLCSDLVASGRGTEGTRPRAAA